MTNLQEIKISGSVYEIIDSIQNFRAEDSFIDKKNKLARFNGNGESKKHIGTYNGKNKMRISSFFDYDKWGLEYSDPNNNRKTFVSAKVNNAVISENKCFFSKENMRKYLNDAKTEYFTQEQHYHNDISEYYNDRLEKVNELENEKIFFSIYDASDSLSQIQNRGYIESDDKIWKLWRELVLPSISYLSILKLVPKDSPNSEPLFYFRILLDYQFRNFQHPKLVSKEQPNDLTIKNIEEQSLKKSIYRVGADKYRRAVINHMPQCPFTQITDERLLIASHIKPYIVCMRNNEKDQAIDHLNGLALSPTYDKLFDQGYITFTDTGELVCGTQLSPYTWEQLNINPNAKNKLRIYPEDREIYLEYHRQNVFQDNIADLL